MSNQLEAVFQLNNTFFHAMLVATVAIRMLETLIATFKRRILWSYRMHNSNNRKWSKLSLELSIVSFKTTRRKFDVYYRSISLFFYCVSTNLLAMEELNNKQWFKQVPIHHVLLSFLEWVSVEKNPHKLIEHVFVVSTFSDTTTNYNNPIAKLHALIITHSHVSLYYVYNNISYNITRVIIIYMGNSPRHINRRQALSFHWILPVEVSTLCESEIFSRSREDSTELFISCNQQRSSETICIVDFTFCRLYIHSFKRNLLPLDLAGLLFYEVCIRASTLCYSRKTNFDLQYMQIRSVFNT